MLDDATGASVDDRGGLGPMDGIMAFANFAKPITRDEARALIVGLRKDLQLDISQHSYGPDVTEADRDLMLRRAMRGLYYVLQSNKALLSNGQLVVSREYLVHQTNLVRTMLLLASAGPRTTLGHINDLFQIQYAPVS
ncbi:hypothetical protein Micbo1qcDRAFT_175717 [Microdochium bolleyi]|uniref:Uncharacterized protein n=1 Tax=Microdochium bolleyi TaxID=196109 RepID=A0A136J337_9PEZI|nr:hypothetical protein Micbo1qcDRAFT_175717 [Microdochium bolleyi]